MILGNKKSLNRGWAMRILCDDIRSLLSLDDSEWKVRRSFIAPSYSTPVIQSFTPILMKEATQLVEQLKSQIDKPLVVTDLVEDCAIRMVLNTSIAGAEKRFSLEETKEFRHAFRRWKDVQHQRLKNPLWWTSSCFNVYKYIFGVDCGMNFLLNYTMKTILQRLDERTKMMTNNGYKGRAVQVPFLDRILDAVIANPESIKRQKSIQQLCEEVLIVMLVSFDSVGTTIQLILHHLAGNPDIQEKVYNEVTELGLGTRDLEYGDFNQVPYLEQVVKESLRLNPPAAAISRVIAEDLNVDGFLIPKGTVGVTSVYYLHRDEDVFSDPEVFDPTRFAPENLSKIPPGSFLPFGDGPRRCIGERIAYLEAKIITGMIIKNFKVELIKSHPQMTTTDVITWIMNPSILKFSLRENCSF